jgi:hypothetical protein
MMRACSLAISVLFLFVHGVAAEAAGPAEVHVVFVRDGVYASPVDEAWDEIPETTYDLMPQMITVPGSSGPMPAPIGE